MTSPAFLFSAAAPTEIYTLSLHDALPIYPVIGDRALAEKAQDVARLGAAIVSTLQAEGIAACGKHFPGHGDTSADSHQDRKSTRLNSSHTVISYAVFCLKKKKKKT